MNYPCILYLPPALRCRKKQELITISHTCNRLSLLYNHFLFIHISTCLFPVTSLCILKRLLTVENALQLALDFYDANRNIIIIELHPRKNRSPGRIEKIGISIRQVAAMHSIPYSQLQRTIAAGGELQARSENDAYNCRRSSFGGMVPCDVQIGISSSARYF